MNTTWDDAKERGTLPEIKNLEDYSKVFQKNLGLLRKHLREKSHPIEALEDILLAHKILFDGIAPWAGTFSHRQQIIGGRPGSPPDLRTQEFQLLKNQMKKLEALQDSPTNIFRIAAFQHARLACIHAFHDGNGRITREITLDRLAKLLGEPLKSFPSKREYLDSLKQTIDSENLVPLTNIFSSQWIGKPDPSKTFQSPFRITPLQIEPWKKTWEEETTRTPHKAPSPSQGPDLEI